MVHFSRIRVLGSNSMVHFSRIRVLGSILWSILVEFVLGSYGRFYGPFYSNFSRIRIPVLGSILESVHFSRIRVLGSILWSILVEFAS